MVAFCRRSWISRSTNSSWVLPRSSPAETRTSPWAPCWCANLHPTSARWLLCRGMQSFVRDSRLREKETKTLALSLSLSPLAANNSVCEEKKLGKKIAASIRGSSSEKVYWNRAEFFIRFRCGRDRCFSKTIVCSMTISFQPYRLFE